MDAGAPGNEPYAAGEGPTPDGTDPDRGSSPVTKLAPWLAAAVLTSVLAIGTVVVMGGGEDDGTDDQVTSSESTSSEDASSPFAEAPKEERELEVVASFWMRTEYFISTFGRVATDMQRRGAP